MNAHNLYRVLRLIHMQASSTHTNTTSDQWSYLHKSIIFLVIILSLEHVLFRLIQKDLIPVINCPLCCMNWYSWGVIRSSHRICTRLHRIRIVVKFYNHTLQLRYRCIPMRGVRVYDESVGGVRWRVPVCTRVCV